MELFRILEVLEICLPVFAILGLGKLLAQRGHLGENQCSFINWLVYHFSLPALIFNAVARQPFSGFWDPAIILIPLLAVGSITALTMLIAKAKGYKGGLAAAFVFGTFWANATYIGIPLCMNAFGDPGEEKAALYNAFVLPFFIIIGYLLIGFYGAGHGDIKIGARLRKAFINPILLSAVAGVIIALIADPFRTPTGELQLPLPIISTAMLTGSFLKLIGSMGLPLALLSIGASLKWEQSRTHLGMLSWSMACKLILLPLLTLLLIQWMVPSASPVSKGVAVILAGTPNAVACYVISCQLGIEKSFVGTMLVVSTGLSLFTIPIWTYIAKGF